MPSKTFGRLLQSLVLLSLGLICYTTTFYLIKAVLIAALICCYIKTNKNSPCPHIKALYVNVVQSCIEFSNGSIMPIESFEILIHNPLFQLIKITNQEDSLATQSERSLSLIARWMTRVARKQLIVIFNDQMSHNDLQLLHVKTIKSSWKKLRLIKPMVK